MLQSNIEHRLQQLHDDYTGADPFPHVVIDEFLQTIMRNAYWQSSRPLKQGTP